MNVAFDLDKNYELDRTLFNRIAKRFQDAGHHVGILTARAAGEGCDVDFRPDFIIFLDCGDLSYDKRAELKAATMKEKKIDIIFDDRADYFPRSAVALNIV